MKSAPRSYSPGWIVTSPGLVVVLVVLISLLVHGGAGYVLRDRPLGRVDLSMLEEVRPPVAIKRATVDQFTPSQGTQGAGEQAESALKALAETMLSEVPLPKQELDELPVDMRAVDEQTPSVAPEELLVELSAFELPREVLDAMNPSKPEDAGFVTSPLGRGSALADAGSGRGQALTALSGAGGAPGGTGTGGGGIPGAGAGGDPMLRPQASRPPTPDQTIMPPIDFEALAQPEQQAEPIEPVILDDDFDYYVQRYETRSDGDLRGYFRVDITAKRSLRKLQTMPKDVVFLIDTSSSLPQEWVNVAVQGVSESLPALNDGDRFNIVLFNESPTALSTTGILPVNAENLAAARAFVGGAQSKGWTDVNAAMRRLLVRDVNSQRAYMLVLISDGKPTRGVLDTRGLINLITRDNDLAASIYCVGIGDEQDAALLDFLAYRNKGFAVHVKKRAEAAAAVRDLMSRLRYPLIKDVRLNFAGLDFGTVYPLDLPDIHQGETFSAYGRYNPANPPRFTMRITGTSGGRPVDFTFTRELVREPAGNKNIATHWAFQKLHHLYSEIIRLGERPELLAEIDRLRREYGLKTLY